MAFEVAREFLRKRGLEGRIMVFDQSSATVELAAAAIGCEPAHIAKTLAFHAGERVALVVCAGDARVDNRKFKERFHAKARMLSPDDAETLVGHGVGGVCPFGVRAGCDVYLDGSLRRFEIVYPACGSANSAVRLSLDELERACEPCAWVDVTRLPA